MKLSDQAWNRRESPPSQPGTLHRQLRYMATSVTRRRSMKSSDGVRIGSFLKLWRSIRAGGSASVPPSSDRPGDEPASPNPFGGAKRRGGLAVGVFAKSQRSSRWLWAGRVSSQSASPLQTRRFPSRHQSDSERRLGVPFALGSGRSSGRDNSDRQPPDPGHTAHLANQAGRDPAARLAKASR